MRRICCLLPAALCLLTLTGSSQGGTFDAVTTGFVSGKLTGQSSFRVNAGGELVIVLSTSAPSPMAVVIIRESGDLPVAETSFPLVAGSCDNDPPSAEQIEQAGRFTVSVRSGSASAPDWVASAQTGTLTIWRSGAGIAGRLDVVACGEHVRSGDRVELTLRGSFQAQASK